MAVPKRKVSRMKRGNRRSADALVAPTYVEDKDSGELRRPHHIDLKSGKYRGARFWSRRKTSSEDARDSRTLAGGRPGLCVRHLGRPWKAAGCRR